MDRQYQKRQIYTGAHNTDSACIRIIGSDDWFDGKRDSVIQTYLQRCEYCRCGESGTECTYDLCVLGICTDGSASWNPLEYVYRDVAEKERNMDREEAVGIAHSCICNRSLWNACICRTGYHRKICGGYGI